MDQTRMSKPLPLGSVRVTDAFWLHEMELVRREVIPYQWKALNDQVPGASPSYCMHNFRAAARLNQRKQSGAAGTDPAFTMRGFEQLPEDPASPDPDHFYGYVFQDSDFSKWIEAVGYSLSNHPDPALEEVADSAIDVVCAAQAEDGYLDTCYILGGMDRRFTNMRDHHELYCLGHLVEGAVAYYNATGKDRLLKAACRFVDYVDTVIGPEDGKKHGYPGHEIAEMALVRLWEVTKEDRYLKLARYFVDERGQEPNYFLEEMAARGEKKPGWSSWTTAYNQADRPVREQEEAQGHAVRAMYLYSGMADIARITGDRSLVEACERLWHSAVEEKMYITGGVGSTHIGEAFTFPYDLPNDSAYSETCAAIGLVFFARRMLQLKPDARYADAMELALYNTVLDGMALDGKSFFYVNPLEVNPVAAHRDERLAHVKTVRQKWFGCACCPPNIARLVSSLGSYVYTASEDTIYTHLYVSGETKATLNGRPVTLEMESGMPWSGRAKLTVHTEGANGTLAFRIPAWSRSATVGCEGKEQTVEEGYCYLTGDWHEGDTVLINLPMQVRAMRADSRVREDVGQVAIMRGPIVYCGEQADNGEDLQLIHLDPFMAPQARVKQDDTTFPLPVNIIELPAERNNRRTGKLYEEWTPDEKTYITLRLIPYFCFANRGEGEMRVWWH